VERSISQGSPAAGRTSPRRVVAGRSGRAALVGLALVLGVLAVYLVSNPNRTSPYNHFVRQAAAWLEGEAAIRLPDESAPDAPANGYFQDTLPVLGPNGEPTGRALLPFPPLPALVLLPFVALWGLATNAQVLAAILGALALGAAWWTIGRLPVRLRSRIGATLFFGLGTVFWYAAMLGTTWYLAHVVAAGLTFLSLGVALGADPGEAEGIEGAEADGAARGRSIGALPAAGLRLLDRRQFAAGFLLGLAATARLTVVFGAPFLLLVGGGGSWRRRGLSAALGAALPLLAFAGYNLATTGHLFHPGYEYQYRLEAVNYTFLGYNPAWAIEDPRYLPQNLALMLGGLPDILPACPAGASRGLFDAACPYLVPNPVGMSLLLTSPGWLLALPALRDYGRSRVVTGALIAVVLIAVVNLMHFSQGWVQFGYRFSNDFAPFGLLLVALGIDQLPGRRGWLAAALIALSVLVNAWGVAWGVILGW